MITKEGHHPISGLANATPARHSVVTRWIGATDLRGNSLYGELVLIEHSCNVLVRLPWRPWSYNK